MLLLSLLITLLGGPAGAFFCTEQGTVLKYERRAPENGRLWWVHTESIDEVTPCEEGFTVDVTSSIKSTIGKSPVKEPVKSSIVVRRDGSVVVDVSRAAAEAARQKFSAFDFSSSGGTSVLPATMAPSDILPDIKAVVSWAGIKLTISYTERIVLRKERISVPAGSFDCIVVQEHKLEKAPLHRRERITLTWYAASLGMIRHDTMFMDGSMETSEVLTEIKR